MKKSSIVVLLLGVIIGLSVALLMHQISGNQRRLRVQYNDWRKLNLVLQTIDENYVDSVDRKKVTDAAIEAADIVLMDDDPLKLSKAIRIAKKCMRIARENIWTSLC